MKKVAVLMGSASDKDQMKPAMDMLAEFGVPAEEHVMSAHRTPERVAEFCKAARDNGFGVLIAGAGMAAALPGTVAAHSTLPVIGVPLSSSSSPLNGVDALYAIVQMPRGMPVATVAIDNAANAGLLAVTILAVEDSELAAKLDAYRQRWRA
jgi:5-(carboxyamino)imidazole ribonucleotide mutase